MKPKENKPEIVYRNIDRKSNKAVGSYSRAYCDEYDFDSVEEAINANCHGIFKDRKKYKVSKYRVTYELLEDDIKIEEPKKTVDEEMVDILSDLVYEDLKKEFRLNKLKERHGHEAVVSRS